MIIVNGQLLIVNVIKCHSRNFLSGISNSIKPDRPPTKDFGGDSHRIGYDRGSHE